MLTDIYFKDYWYARMHEQRGIQAPDLPKLSAIIGCHGVFDHWNPRSLRAYRWKGETPVFCATQSMVKSAKKFGFSMARLLNWGQTTELGDLTIEAVQAQYAIGLKVNNYVLQSAKARIFFGTETRDLKPLVAYRKKAKPVDLALLPIDGATVLGQRLVALPHEAINAARILGAPTRQNTKPTIPKSRWFYTGPSRCWSLSSFSSEISPNWPPPKA